MDVIESTNKNEISYMILKVGDEYFCDAWEEWDADVDNFSFTSNIESAYKFYGGLSPKWGNAPKYLCDDKGEIIDTLEQAQEYFGGDVLTVNKKVTTITRFEVGNLSD